MNTRNALMCGLVLCLIVATNGVGCAADAASSSGFFAPGAAPTSRYEIDCTITETTDGLRLDGSETISLSNPCDTPIRTLIFDWRLGSQGDIKVSVGGVAVPVTKVSSSKPMAALLRCELPEPITADGEEEILAAFALTMPAGTTGMEHMTGWYPRLWWGYESHDDYSVKLSAPEGYVAYASGGLDGASRRYEVRGARSFGLMLAKDMQVLEGRAGDVVVRAVCTEKARPCAQVLLETAIDTIGFYRERLGLYPYACLTIVPGESDPKGGYPVATTMVAIHGEEVLAGWKADDYRWIVVHEIGHQYWGEYVLEKDNPGWLWVALGLYTDREFCRARGFASGNHSGYLERYVGAVRGFLDTTVERDPATVDDLSYDFNGLVIHAKAFSIISALECAIGAETFERAYRRCLSEFGGRRMGVADLQAVCEEESGQDLGWFFDQWVRSNRYLSYSIESTQSILKGEAYASTVRVRCGGTLRMPVPVEAVFADGTRQIGVSDRLADLSEVVFDSASPMVDARVDPAGQLPNVIPAIDPRAKAVGAEIAALAWTGAGGQASELLPKARSAGLAESFLWFKLGMALYDGKLYEEALEAFETGEQLEKEPVLVFADIVWQGMMSDLLGRRDNAMACYRKALECKSRGPIEHDQYKLVLDAKWVGQRLQTPFTRVEAAESWTTR